MSLVLRKGLLTRNSALLRCIKGRNIAASTANKKGLSPCASAALTCRSIRTERFQRLRGTRAAIKPRVSKRRFAMLPRLGTSCPKLVQQSLPRTHKTVEKPARSPSADSVRNYAAKCCPPPSCCECLPPPNPGTQPKCIQYMSGYYYYPYGFWFCGPYHEAVKCPTPCPCPCPPGKCPPPPCCCCLFPTDPTDVDKAPAGIGLSAPALATVATAVDAKIPPEVARQQSKHRNPTLSPELVQQLSENVNHLKTQWTCHSAHCSSFVSTEAGVLKDQTAKVEDKPRGVSKCFSYSSPSGQTVFNTVTPTSVVENSSSDLKQSLPMNSVFQSVSTKLTTKLTTLKTDKKKYSTWTYQLVNARPTANIRCRKLYRTIRHKRCHKWSF